MATNTKISDRISKYAPANLDSSEEDNGSQKGVRMKKTVLTTCIYCHFICIGLVTPLIGSCFVHLVAIYQTDITMMSMTFPVSAAGYLLGPVICAVLYERLNKELQYMCISAMLSLTTIFLPLMPEIYTFLTIVFLQNIAVSFADAAGQAYIISLWNNHRLKEPFMLGMNCVLSLGALVTPVVVSSFLEDIPENTTATDRNGDLDDLHNNISFAWNTI